MPKLIERIKRYFLLEKVKKYIESNYVKPRPPRPQREPAEPVQTTHYVSDMRYSLADDDDDDGYDPEKVRAAIQKLSIEKDPSLIVGDILKSTNSSFVAKLLEYISSKNLEYTDVYKAALIDRRLFSKIISDTNYKPSKDTCIALCFALKLSLEETNSMLKRAGYSLSHSDKRDLIIEYFFQERKYDVNAVNEVLYSLNAKTL